MSAISEAEAAALHEALDDEYRAWATYDQVISDFGEIRPFTNIREAEARHIDALIALFERYGLPVPANPWPGRVTRYDSPIEACRAGVAAEIANAGLYEKLIASCSRPDIVTVLQNLQSASRERHLPAFRRCAERSGGRGRRHRGGH